MKYYQDLATDVQTTFNSHYDVTEEEIIEVGQRWDSQPFHVDKQAAENTIFGGLVGSSVHVFAIFVAIGDRDSEEKAAAVSALGFNNMKMRLPIRPGDRLRVRYTITDKRPSGSHPNVGVVSVESEMFNQNDEIVFSVENAFLCKMRPVD